MHEIKITPAKRRVRVLWHGKVIAESERALDLAEASYPVVKYIPREDADMSLLHKTAHHSHCPYKGDASYFSIDVDGKTADNAVWSYETPLPAVPQIKDHLAFYGNVVTIVEA